MGCAGCKASSPVRTVKEGPEGGQKYCTVEDAMGPEQPSPPPRGPEGKPSPPPARPEPIPLPELPGHLDAEPGAGPEGAVATARQVDRDLQEEVRSAAAAPAPPAAAASAGAAAELAGEPARSGGALLQRAARSTEDAAGRDAPETGAPAAAVQGGGPVADAGQASATLGPGLGEPAGQEAGGTADGAATHRSAEPTDEAPPAPGGELAACPEPPVLPEELIANVRTKLRSPEFNARLSFEVALVRHTLRWTGKAKVDGGRELPVWVGEVWRHVSTLVEEVLEREDVGTLLRSLDPRQQRAAAAQLMAELAQFADPDENFVAALPEELTCVGLEAAELLVLERTPRLLLTERRGPDRHPLLVDYFRMQVSDLLLEEGRVRFLLLPTEESARPIFGSDAPAFEPAACRCSAGQPHDLRVLRPGAHGVPFGLAVGRGGPTAPGRLQDLQCLGQALAAHGAAHLYVDADCIASRAGDTEECHQEDFADFLDLLPVRSPHLYHVTIFSGSPAKVTALRRMLSGGPIVPEGSIDRLRKLMLWPDFRAWAERCRLAIADQEHSPLHRLVRAAQGAEKQRDYHCHLAAEMRGLLGGLLVRLLESLWLREEYVAQSQVNGVGAHLQPGQVAKFIKEKADVWALAEKNIGRFARVLSIAKKGEYSFNLQGANIRLIIGGAVVLAGPGSVSLRLLAGDHDVVVEFRKGGPKFDLRYLGPDTKGCPSALPGDPSKKDKISFEHLTAGRLVSFCANVGEMQALYVNPGCHPENMSEALVATLAAYSDTAFQKCCTLLEIGHRWKLPRPLE